MKVRLPVYPVAPYEPIRREPRQDVTIAFANPPWGATYATVTFGEGQYAVRVRDLMQLGHAAALCCPLQNADLEVVEGSSEEDAT